MREDREGRICSAGLVYFYICGKEENDEIVIEYANSYEFLPDGFYQRVCALTKYMENINGGVELFGVLGLSEKVNDVKEIVGQGIRRNFENIIEGKCVKKSNKRLDSAGNTFYRLIQEYFCCMNIHKPTYDILQNEECLAVIFYDEQVEKPQVIIDALNLWLEKEDPMILGKQAMIQSFLLTEIIGRMVIGILPEWKYNGWNVVLEGGLKLSLAGQPHFTGERVGYYDVDLMTAGQIDEIVGNPVYAYGKIFSPIGVFRGWNKAFLYACAVSDEDWTAKKIENAYNRLLQFLEEHICTVEYAPPMIDMKIYIGALQSRIMRIRLYLKGEDEQVVSKDILKLMNTKYVYLPYIYGSVGIKRKLNNLVESFSKNHLKELLDASETSESYNKGIAWERVAEYILQYVEGLTITGKRIRTKHQEIDISIANTSISNGLWKLGAYILVECKNWSKKVDIGVIRNLAHISTLKGNKTIILFAYNGITKDAKEEIYRLCGENIYIIVITKDDLLKIRDECDCRSIIIDKWEEMDRIRNTNLVI